MSKELKNIVVGNKEYTYIDNKEGDSSVSGMELNVTTKVKEELVENVGGMTRDIFKKIDEDKTIHTIVILMVTSGGMTKRIGIYMKGKDEIYDRYTEEQSFFSHLKNKFIDKGIHFKEINSLEYIRDNEDIDRTIIMEEYYNPKCLDDTGMYLEEEMIDFGKVLKVKDVNKLYDFCGIKDRTLLKRYQPDKVELVISEELPTTIFGSGGRLKFKKNGDYLLNTTGIILKNKDVGVEHAESLSQLKDKDILTYAIKVNDRIDEIKDKEERHNWIHAFDKEIDDIEEDIYEVRLGYKLVVKILEEGLVEKKDNF